MRIVILGGGIAGLIAANVLKRDHEVTVIEAGRKLGGNFNAGGLKYIRVTEAMMALLESLDIEFKTYIPRGKVILESGMHPWPPKTAEGPHDSISIEVVRLIQHIHWLKTRGSMWGFTATCMNDPMGNGGDPALLCDHSALMDALIRSISVGVNIHTSTLATRVNLGNVECQDGGRVLFDRLIVTVPLPVAAKVIPMQGWPNPVHHGIALATLADDGPVARWSKYNWDYAYTPLDPLVSRVSKSNGVMQAEAPYNMASPAPTAAHFAAAGWRLAGPVTHLPGHLVPMEAPVKWPEGIIPLGRFAQWDSRMTVERVLDQAIKLREML